MLDHLNRFDEVCKIRNEPERLFDKLVVCLFVARNLIPLTDSIRRSMLNIKNLIVAPVIVSELGKVLDVTSCAI